jgi:hypothetical protein
MCSLQVECGHCLATFGMRDRNLLHPLKAYDRENIAHVDLCLGCGQVRALKVGSDVGLAVGAEAALSLPTGTLRHASLGGGDRSIVRIALSARVPAA